MRNKKAAIEMSIGTIVVIVLAMTMLIMGLVLIRSIFGTATKSVNTIDSKLQGQLVDMFGDESQAVFVKLGSDNTAKIKAGTLDFGMIIGGRTADGSAVGNRNRLKFILSLDKDTQGNCVDILGAKAAENLFKTKIGTEYSMDKYEGDMAFAIVQISVPEGTSLCTQKVYIDIRDTEVGNSIGGNFFIVNIVRAGIF
jgi:hypothetical protein